MSHAKDHSPLLPEQTGTFDSLLTAYETLSRQMDLLEGQASQGTLAQQDLDYQFNHLAREQVALVDQALALTPDCLQDVIVQLELSRLVQNQSAGLGRPANDDSLITQAIAGLKRLVYGTEAEELPL